MLSKFIFSILIGFIFGIVSTIDQSLFWDWINGGVFLLSLYFLFYSTLFSFKKKNQRIE